MSRMLFDVARECSRPDAYTFVLYGGIGDQVLWLTHMAAFRKHHGPVRLVVDERSTDIANMFPWSYDEKFIVTEDVLPNRWITPPHMPKGYPMLCWHHAWSRSVEYEAVRKRECVLRVIQRLLRLPADVEQTLPYTSHDQRIVARSLFKTCKLREDETVFLAPYANTIGVDLPPPYWVSLINWLSAQGYKVALNAATGVRGFDGSPSVSHWLDFDHPSVVHLSFDLRLAIPFAEACGHVLAVHSGFPTLLARAHCTKTIIYPFKHGLNPVLHANTSFWSQKQCWPKEDIHELDIDAAKPFDPMAYREHLGERRPMGRSEPVGSYGHGHADLRDSGTQLSE